MDNSDRKGMWLYKKVPCFNSFTIEFKCVLCNEIQIEAFDVCPNCNAKMTLIMEE